MKIVSIYAALLLNIFTTSTSFSQITLKKENIKVWGNCGMCKTNIEKAAKKAGATAANWNEETKKLKVSYVIAKTSSAKIQTAIAKAGYDTETVTANVADYKKLHGCCQYQRKVITNMPAANENELVTYNCPMHKDVTSLTAGKCSKCGMDLKQNNK